MVKPKASEMIDVSEFPIFKTRFCNIFGLELQEYMDMNMLIVCRSLMFDVCKFTDWLEWKYPKECQMESASYKDVVLSKFGKSGVELITKLIG